MSKKRVKKKKVSKFNTNLCLLMITLFLLTFLFVRVCYLSLSKEVYGTNLKNLASSRTTKRDTILAKRGTIYDLNGELLAQNVYSYTLIAYLEPNRGEGNYVKDKEKTAELLSTVIDMSKEDILSLLNKNLYQTEFGNVGRGLTEIKKDKIVSLNLDGLDFIESQKRYYPKGDFLSYTIGYAKQNNDGEIVGELGLEQLYNKQLTGTNGSREYIKDLRGYQIPNTKEIITPAHNGDEIYLTIDSSIQFLVEQAIENVKNKYTFGELNIVVCEAKTGRILAISSSTSFDPNIRNITNYMDPNVSIPFEPGSTMKIFSYMAVMENGKYNGNETYKSGTYVTTDGTKISDWDKNGWGNITFDWGFAQSSNVAVINLLKSKITKEELREYYKKLGFGSKTGIELANEANGKLDFNYETEYYNAGFGQGIMVTSIQNVKALTAVANDGILLQPYLVDKIVDSNGKVIVQNKRTELGRVAKKETTDYIKNLMNDVVTKATGRHYNMPDYNLIGKTGTAQVSSTDGTGYLAGLENVIHSFAGMYPKDNPDIIIYGNLKKRATVAPLTVAIKEIITNVNKIRNNTEEPSIKVETITLKSYLNKTVGESLTSLKSKNITPIIIGNGDKVIRQYPEYNKKITSNEKVFLYTNSEDKMLNLNGWSKKEIDAYCNIINKNCLYEGTGYSYEQSIRVGTQLNEFTDINIKLKDKF